MAPRQPPSRAGEFEAAAHALAARLPRKPYVVNLCEDRYAFTVAFAAALIAGQTTLLPPSRAPQAVRDSCEGRDCLYVDGCRRVQPGTTSAPETHSRSIRPTSPRSSSPRAAPAGRCRTRKPGARWWRARARSPRASARSGSDRRHGAAAAHVRPRSDGDAAVAERPGDALAAGRCCRPTSARRWRDAAAPRWLMTSPLHLRACVAARQPLPGLAGVLSSTMPLDVAARRRTPSGCGARRCSRSTARARPA